MVLTTIVKFKKKILYIQKYLRFCVDRTRKGLVGFKFSFVTVVGIRVRRRALRGVVLMCGTGSGGILVEIVIVVLRRVTNHTWSRLIFL